MTFLIALYTSKIGVLAFLGRITKQKSQLLGYYTCIILGVIFCIMSILIVTIDCPSSSTFYWAFHLNRTSCPSQVIPPPLLPPSSPYKTPLTPHPSSQSASKSSPPWTSQPSSSSSPSPPTSS